MWDLLKFFSALQRTIAETYCGRIGAIHYALGVPFTADNWLIVKRAVERRYLMTYECERGKSEQQYVRVQRLSRIQRVRQRDAPGIRRVHALHHQAH